jgi:hypothetical protein
MNLFSVFMSLANPLSGGKIFGGFGKNPDKWMKKMIRKLQRKTSNTSIKIRKLHRKTSNTSIKIIKFGSKKKIC